MNSFHKVLKIINFCFLFCFSALMLCGYQLSCMLQELHPPALQPVAIFKNTHSWAAHLHCPQSLFRAVPKPRTSLFLKHVGRKKCREFTKTLEAASICDSQGWCMGTDCHWLALLNSGCDLHGSPVKAALCGNLPDISPSLYLLPSLVHYSTPRIFLGNLSHFHSNLRI